MNRSYVPPSGAELRALLRRWMLTGARAGRLVDVGSRQIRRWTGGDAVMPFAALYTLCARADSIRIRPGSWREDLAAAFDVDDPDFGDAWRETIAASGKDWRNGTSDPGCD